MADRLRLGQVAGPFFYGGADPLRNPPGRVPLLGHGRASAILGDGFPTRDCLDGRERAMAVREHIVRRALIPRPRRHGYHHPGRAASPRTRRRANGPGADDAGPVLLSALRPPRSFVPARRLGSALVDPWVLCAGQVAAGGASAMVGAAWRRRRVRPVNQVQHSLLWVRGAHGMVVLPRAPVARDAGAVARSRHRPGDRQPNPGGTDSSAFSRGDSHDRSAQRPVEARDGAGIPDGPGLDAWAGAAAGVDGPGISAETAGRSGSSPWLVSHRFSCCCCYRGSRITSGRFIRFCLRRAA